MGKNNVKTKFNRNHLVIMALGNIIGSGIFLGSGNVINISGPSAILAYAFGGLVMLMEIMFIAEMSIINPAPGSFRVHASEIFGNWIGFVNGWMFWFSGILGMASEVVAAALFTKLWLSKIPLWVFCIIYTVIMTIINLKDVRGLSRIESLLASVKVISLILFIAFGFSVLFHIIPFKASGIPAIKTGGFFPKGINGLFASMIMVMFSYTGTGIIGLAIADTKDPSKNAPSAIYTIGVSVILLYTLSISFIVLLMPWNKTPVNSSPFVDLLNSFNIPFSSNLLNFIVLTASLSGLNSSMYSASRMLNSLSRDGQASRLFVKENKNGVPVYALGLSSFVLLVTAILSYIIPDEVFMILATASGFTALTNWLTISITHFFYRRKTLKEHPEKLKYKAPGYPYISFTAVILIIMIFATSPLYPGQVSGLLGSIILFILLLLTYFYLKSLKKLQ